MLSILQTHLHIYVLKLRNFFFVKTFDQVSIYFSLIHYGKLILMFSNLSGTGRRPLEIQAGRSIITSCL